MFLLRYMAKPDPVTLSDKIGSTLSQEEPPLFPEVAGPLIAGLTEYANPAFGQSTFCSF